MKYKARSTNHEIGRIFFSFMLHALCLMLLFTQLPVSSFDLIVKTKKTVKDKTSKEEAKAGLKSASTEKKIPVNESDFQPILIGVLLENPQDYIDKKIKFRGKFSSFTTLALDYKPAMRSSKDYISICIFRTDSKIPLSELKLAYPVKEAKEDLVIREMEEGDLLEIYGKVFSSALDEPWVDILQIKKIESSSTKKIEDKKIEKSQDKKPINGEETKNKKKNKKESD